MTNKTLYLAVILSTGLHLAVLLPLVSNQQAILIGSSPRPMRSMAMVVTVVGSPQSEQTPIKSIAMPSVVKAESASNPTAKNTKHAVPARMDKQPTEHKLAEKSTQTARSTVSIALIEHDMLAYLHSEFRVRFQYPLLARKRGWSGEVVIALNVNHNGMIDHIAVKKSSGYPLLDNNAIDTFRAIGLVTPAIQSRINNRHQLSIPVIYKLTGS